MFKMTEKKLGNWITRNTDATTRKLKTPIPWKPRLGEFRRANLTFNPMTGEGFSYNWYQITRVVKGVMVLNSYPYSVTTAKHVGLLRRLLGSLGIPYRECYAPKGLNGDTVEARRMTAETIGRWTVKARHSRDGRMGTWETRLCRELSQGIVALTGKPLTTKELKAGEELAEIERKERLERAKQRREAATVSRNMTSAANAHVNPYTGAE